VAVTRTARRAQAKRLTHPSGFDELMPTTLATVDRILHHAHVCQTNGDSVRLTQGIRRPGVGTRGGTGWRREHCQDPSPHPPPGCQRHRRCRPSSSSYCAGSGCRTSAGWRRRCWQRRRRTGRSRPRCSRHCSLKRSPPRRPGLCAAVADNLDRTLLGIEVHDRMRHSGHRMQPRLLLGEHLRRRRVTRYGRALTCLQNPSQAASSSANERTRRADSHRSAR
jgi:hypothetical protein